MRKAIASLLIGAMLAACAVVPQIHHYQLAALDKGLAPADVVGKLKLPPDAIQNQQADGRSFQFYRYLMNNGIQLDNYLLAFEGDKLVYWGYLDEFRKHPDKALAAAAGAMAPTLTTAR